jgi:uncharacterized protein (TIGR03382 family)
MTSVLAFCVRAGANSWGPYDDGFVIEARTDAPIDAVLVYVANYLPVASATDGGGNEVALGSALLTGVGSDPRVALSPPDGGWGVGASWNVAVLGYDGTDGVAATLAFTTGTEPAAPPADVVVGEITVGAWSGPTTYPWGCCLPIRTVRVPVSVPTADPWGWVEVVGRFDLGRPSQITTEEVHQHLDLEVGPGEHVLEFVQWEDDRGPQPPCFDVVAVSASGVRGAPQPHCTDEAGTAGGTATNPGGTTGTTGTTGTSSDDEGDRDGTTSAGCDTAGGSGVLPLAALMAARRRRPAPRGRGVP